MADTIFLQEWEKAKLEFEKITGKSKPKPNGKIAKAFNHSGLTGDLKTADKLMAALRKKQDKGNIDAGLKHIPSLKKSGDAYLKVLDDAVKDELADAGEKTTYSKALKYLRSTLDALVKTYENLVISYQIALDKEANAHEKAARMVHTALKSTLAQAVAAAKEIKVKPNAETYNKVFNKSDNPARKVQVQLVAASNAHKKGLLPEAAQKRVDARFVSDMFTPFQAGGKGKAIADESMDDKIILGLLGEFTKMLKLANAYLDDLEAAL